MPESDVFSTGPHQTTHHQQHNNMSSSQFHDLSLPYDKTHYSLRPWKCLRMDKPHCRGANRTKYYGHVNPKLACYPVEVTQTLLDRYKNKILPPQSEMHPWELETLHDKEFVSLETTGSVQTSRFITVEPQKHYKIGDVIKVRIDLADGNGMPRTVGGDDVRVWMTSTDKSFRIAGEVIDFKNGSYVASLKALWEGDMIIYGVLPFTREITASLLRWHRQYGTLFYFTSLYQNKGIKERTMCSVLPRIPGYSKICNHSSINYNLPLYCVQPTRRSLTCRHLYEVYHLDFINIPLTNAEFQYLYRYTSRVFFASQIKLTVSKAITRQRNLMNCNKLPKRETWRTQIPTGYMNGTEWTPLNCRNPMNYDSAKTCLKNTTVFLYGDSTVRQWYHSLAPIFGDFKHFSGKWYNYTKHYNKTLNSTLIWAPQAFPYVTSHVDSTGQLSMKSLEYHLNTISLTDNVIFVFHFYTHYIRHHYSLYLQLVRSLKQTLRTALQRIKNLKIAIKGPHAFYSSECPYSKMDFYAKLYTDILEKELEEFKDSIWFLNYWEMTMIVENNYVHPETVVVWENIRLLLGYVC